VARAVQVSGHGNFGSLDNDPAAAMRYTECRLQAFASAVLLADLEFDTVGMAPTFDGSQARARALHSRSGRAPPSWWRALHVSLGGARCARPCAACPARALGRCAQHASLGAAS